MNTKPFLSSEQLAMYQDGLLPEEDRKRVETLLESDPETQNRLHELEQLDETLVEWGRRNRMREAVARNVRLNRSHARQEKQTWFVLSSPMVSIGWAAVFACLFTIWWWAPFSSHPPKIVVIGAVEWTRTDGGAVEDIPRIGDRIHVEKGYLALQMGDRSSILEVGADSQAQLLGPRHLRVDQGAVCNTVSKDPKHPYIVVTPHGTVQVLGTVFTVEVTEEKTVVQVNEGRVRLVPNNQKTSDQDIINAGYAADLCVDRVSKPRKFNRTEFNQYVAKSYKMAIKQGGMDTKGMASTLKKTSVSH